MQFMKFGAVIPETVPMEKCSFLKFFETGIMTEKDPTMEEFENSSIKQISNTQVVIHQVLLVNHGYFDK